MKKNVIIIIIIILLIFLAMIYIINLNNNHQEITNNTHNNTTNVKINKTPTKNISLKNNVIKNDDNKYYDSSQNKPKNNNKDSNDSYDERMEAKLGVEKYVLDKDEVAGYPVYKHPRLGSWLVPIFDKKTKKFKGSVYIYKGGSAFIQGPQSYSEYKKVISGKTDHKSNSNKHVEISKYKPNLSVNAQKTIKIQPLGKAKPNTVFNEQTNINLDNKDNFNSDQIILDDLNDCSLSKTLL